MGRSRVPERVAAGRRDAPLLPAPPVGTEPAPTMRDLLLRSWAGRLFLIAAVVKLILGGLRILFTLPAFLDILGIAATLGLIISLSYFIWRLFVLSKRRLLWRVRRKLIISYIFMGVVPALLIIGFFLLGAGLVSMNVSAYLFKDGYDALVEDISVLTEAAARDIARDPAGLSATLERSLRVAGFRHRNSNVSLAFVPASGARLKPVHVGPWEHAVAPTSIPAWARDASFAGTIALPVDEATGAVQLAIRGISHAIDAQGQAVGSVISDLAVDDQALASLYDRTGVKAGAASIGSPGSTAATAVISAGGDKGGSLFRNSVAFLDCALWVEAEKRPDCRATISTTYRVGELWSRLSNAQPVSVKGESLEVAFLVILGLVAVLFLIIQGVALLMGLTLARSITSSIHELFMGTERVRQGDFGHRIEVTTNDQLGELAHSFNQMTGSIEGLLQTAAEKKRLDEELRIARQIQMSLLPRGPLDTPGLSITALCVPAREVGGDYYDFFDLPDDRLGVLIADVAGKGTSAALYMAELKGLVLGLSQTQMSPRDMLIEVNRIISDNLDSRSFITMTYGVIDRRAGTMTYCRAGHTPLIFLPGPASALPGVAQVLIPSGLVVGLRIPGAAEKFAGLLEEQTIELAVGDVIAFYTDGISEAMNADSDLFGDSRLSDIIEEHGHLSSGELRERILREIESFVGGADQHDDMTMILLKVEQSFLLAAV
ncbi:MAG: SpoIIE family protein phosphatase [Acidobacteriota bacterium]|nr:SpoIIE family protein phosphatase [Acidobacteriota bacterium]